ncbi:MAG: PilZ domain-containing protein [candidate division NC10 bacterium]|nr:PilZ domain-containing protein [candidate division NC10 bacterium]
MLKTESVRITVREGKTVMGTMHDLSRGGILVAIPEELELGSIYRIELTDSEGVLSLLGEALRLYLPATNVTSDEPRIFKAAFEFVGVDNSGARRLRRLVGEIGS